MTLSEAGYEESKHTGCIEAIRRRGLTNISDVITAVVGVYLDLYALKEPCEINHGMCEDFAEDVCSLIPGAEAHWDDELGSDQGSHKIIVYQGRYYDSQCPEGTDDWRSLVRLTPTVASMTPTIYVRKEPTTDSVALTHCGRDQLAQSSHMDWVFYASAEAQKPVARVPWYYSNGPRRNAKTYVLNCFRYRLVWL